MRKSRGRIYGLTPSDTVARARQHVGDKACKYQLGDGGTTPESMVPWDSDGGLDCSGFVAWCLGYDRYQQIGDKPKGYWLNTDVIRAGGRNDFVEVDRPAPGVLLVYGRHPFGKKPYIGHVGMIVSVPAEWDSDEVPCWHALQVAHCHGPNGRRPGIEITGAYGWYLHRHRMGGTRFMLYKDFA